jgi:hypothetical protein
MSNGLVASSKLDIDGTGMELQCLLSKILSGLAKDSAQNNPNGN